MSTARQSDLLAGETWLSLYTEFLQNVNFNASDPASIKAALEQTVQKNYPENFNDWIVSSEFVAIIELLSWLAGTLAFKTDIAARENFIDTAEAKESILRLARFLSYNPSRCQTSIGLLKITQVQTNDAITDSFGNSLANQPIYWNDPSNSNWYEQFTLVMNDAFIPTNPFGVPLASSAITGITSQLYRLNGFASAQNLGFSSTVSGTSMDFEVCNAAFNSDGTLSELAPNPANAMQLYYLNDGSGNGSAQTGFFLLFKQGTTSSQTVNIATPVQNQIINIGVANINQTDVWVNTVDDSGNVTINWTNVATVDSNIGNNNITYNNVAQTTRNIFSVLTRDNDQVSIRFADGNFGNAPIGNIKVSYRVSNGLAYVINPAEIDSISLPFSYTNSDGVQHTLTLTFSLFSQVATSAASETLEQIRLRAPQVYATQDRMVSGQDYNSFPASSNLAVKVQAVNRVYSGQSRYIDLHDPTGTFQDLSIFAEDGILFREEADTYFEVPTAFNLSAAQLYTNYVQPAIEQTTTADLIRDVLMSNVLARDLVVPNPNGSGTVALSTMIGQGASSPLIWTASSATLYAETGAFNQPCILIQPGAMIQFSIQGTPTWVAVVAVQADINTPLQPNAAGAVTLSAIVPSNSPILAILPQVLLSLPTATISTIQSNFNNRVSFSLWYDYLTNGGSWTVTAAQNDFGPPAALTFLPGQTAVGSPTTLLIMNVNFVSGLWRINSRGSRLVFESVKDVQWYDNLQRGLAMAQATGETAADSITVLKVNQNVQSSSRGFALGVNSVFDIAGIYNYPDGTPETRRSVITLDQSETGYPIAPDAFNRIISDQPQNQYLFWANTASPPYDEPINSVIVYDTDTTRNSPLLIQATAPINSTQFTVSSGLAQLAIGMLISGPNITAGSTITAISQTGFTASLTTLGAVSGQIAVLPAIGTIAYQVASNTSYLYDGTFWTMTPTGWVQDTTSFRAAIGRGPNVAAAWITQSGSTQSTTLPVGDALAFQWKHFAPSDHRINPATTNIIDIFVLTTAYDAAVRQWIINGAVATDEPATPTELELSTAFSSLETYKMFSDTIVWRPVTYKYLFGQSADPSVQAQFKVVRLANATVSDGQIQTQILAAINAFFAVSLWDFGESFYASELTAYVHQQLAGLISSFVLVPKAANAAFGDGYEITANADEIMISTAQISDIVLINSNTAANLRIS